MRLRNNHGDKNEISSWVLNVGDGIVPAIPLGDDPLPTWINKWIRTDIYPMMNIQNGE